MRKAHCRASKTSYRTRALSRLVFASVGVVLLAITPSALATPKSINGFIGGSGGINQGGLFTQPRDVAVYTGGTLTRADDKIFVAELGASDIKGSRIQRLDEHGNFEMVWGRDVVAPGFPGNTGDTYEVCTAVVTGSAGCKAAEKGQQAGMLEGLTGLAVNQATGHVYAADTANNRVQEFDLDGNFIRAWGWDVIPAGDPDDTGSGFEICTDACQAGDPGTAAGQFAGSGIVNTVAVAPAAPDDVFVADAGNRRVMQFESDGAFVRAWGWDVAPEGASGDTLSNGFEICTDACQAGQLSGGIADGKFASGSPQQLTVDSSGIVYASDTSDGDRLVRFDSNAPASAPLTPLESPGLLSDGATIGLDVRLDTGNLLAARDPSSGPTVIDEIVDPGTEPPPAGPPADVHVYSDVGQALGLAYNTVTGSVYLGVRGLFAPPTGPFTGCVPLNPSFDCHGVMALATATSPLTAELDDPADIGATTASLAASVDPGGGVASYRFQVSRDGASWNDVGEPAYADAAASIDVVRDASGLEPATLYRVRLLASKQTGISSTEEVISNERVFLTDAVAPDVSTLGPSRRTDSSVRLRGLVDPQGSATSYRFEYGLAGGSFDQHVPDSDASAGSGNEGHVVLQEVSGLQPDTAYHYRVVATNSVGTSFGDAVTFTTRSSAVLPPPPAGRAYELVSPADKVSGVGVGVWFKGPATAGEAGYGAHEGERFAVQGNLGAVLLDGEYALANDWALSERTPQGWLSKPLLSRRAHGAHPIVFIGSVSATPSLSMTAWGGTTVKLFAEMSEWRKEVAGSTLYLRDWSQGKWELFGPTEEDQGGGDGLMFASALAADGKSIAASGTLRGLAGVADSTLDAPADTRNVYLDELPGGPSDTFPGAGVRSPMNVCDDDTLIPDLLPSGKLGAQACVDAPERQSVAVDATGGTFTLAFDGQSITAIPFDAPATGAGSVQEALEDLPNLAVGDVAVTRITVGPGATDTVKPYVVRFRRQLGDVPELTADGSGLTGGLASVAVETVPVAPLVGEGGAVFPHRRAGAISSDGSRVFFVSPDPGPFAKPCFGAGATTFCPTQVYMRQGGGGADAVTRWISRTEVTQANGASADQDASLTGQAIFEGASADGDKALFSTASPLTADDPNGEGAAPVGGIVSGTPNDDSWDLYMYDLPDAPGADPADGDLTRISAGPEGGGDCNSPAGGGKASGALRFVSADGSRVYFTCAAPLDGVPVPGSGTSALPGGSPSTTDAVNLYLYDANEPLAERWQFIARLPRTSPLGSCAASATAPGLPLAPKNSQDPDITIFENVNCFHGTDDGSLVIFWTDGQLTDDDPDTTSGDVYAYDADREELVRATAPQGGIGGAYPCAPGLATPLCYGDGGFGDLGGAAPLPALGLARDPSNGSPMVFFQSRSRLIPADKDTTYDVYQWRDGELSLISSAQPNTGDAFFKGNDRTGTNVYLASRDRLSWQDRDAVLDVYSARIGDGIPEPPDTQEHCDLGPDQCQGPGQPVQPVQTDSDTPSDGNPPSAGRATLDIAAPGSKARRRAARTGRLRVRITSTAPLTVTLTARGRLGGRTKQVARATGDVGSVGSARLTLRLSKAARKRLRGGKSLRLTLRVSGDGTRPASMQIRLKR